MGFTCGIIGLPNVGKSTIFNALTSAKAQAANFPFCTIEPNTGAVAVPDPRLQILRDIASSEKLIPTQITFVDIAGLIRGASKGEGLGNQFLGHIRSVDAVAHVVRCFDDENVVHVDGGVDPLRDVDTIETELLLADLDAVQKQMQKIEKSAKAGDKDAKEQLEVLKEVESLLGKGTSAREVDQSTDVRKLVVSNLLTAKPVMFVANVMEDDLVEQKSPALNALKEFAAKRGDGVVVICGKVESEIAEMPLAERADYFEALGIDTSGLDRLAIAGYQLLKLRTYFTVGPKEVHAWTVTGGTKAPKGAGVIHSDFERGFIRAEVISYDDYVGLGGELKAKEAGKLRVEGKEYEVQDGDIMHFRFNV